MVCCRIFEDWVPSPPSWDPRPELTEGEGSLRYKMRMKDLQITLFYRGNPFCIETKEGPKDDNTTARILEIKLIVIEKRGLKIQKVLWFTIKRHCCRKHNLCTFIVITQARGDEGGH